MLSDILGKGHLHHKQAEFNFSGMTKRYSGIATAIVAAAVIGGVSANQSSKAAAKSAQEQRDWQTAQAEPAKTLEQLQLQQYQDITMPYNQDIYQLWQDYGKAQTETQYGLQKDLTTQLGANLTQPLQLPQDVWDKIWQQTREKSFAEYAPIEQRTSQRLAATGGIGGGPGESLFKDIELSKAKSIETLAINQAISEWNEKKAAQQQSYENIFKLLGYPASTSTPSSSTSAVGTTVPYTAIPDTTSGVAEGIGTGLNTALSLFSAYGTGAGGKAPTTDTITGGVGGTSSYNSQFGNVWSPYKV